MSTNYYFKVEADSVFDNDENRYPDIHIGKRSAGWKPIFQASNFYSSVDEIVEFYIKYKNILTIVNEYEEKLTLQELEEELFNWESCRNWRSHDYNIYLDNRGYEFSGVEFS